jgi:cell wall-associated NlpC family hydrolase
MDRSYVAQRLIRTISSLLLAALVSACAAPHIAPQVQAPLQIPPPQKDGATLFVEQALAMLGQPYRYGGAGPGGFDCSGLVVYAARQSGLLLPRTTQDLRTAGSAVSRDELRPGDLVFMHLAAKELHVGILLDDRRFVHAPSSGGVVRIDTLDRDPYAHGFLGARRLSFPP